MGISYQRKTDYCHLNGHRQTGILLGQIYVDKILFEIVSKVN